MMSRRYFSDIQHQPTTSSVASKCIVCECSLNPKILQFVACGHHFCSRCFENLKSNSPLKGTNLRCPVVDGVMNLDKEFGGRSYQVFIDDFRLKCSFAKRGCQWYGRLDNLQSHKSRCNFSIIQNNPLKQSSASNTNDETAIFKILLDFEKKLSKKDKEYEALKKTEKETASLMKGLSERLLEAERKLREKDGEVTSFKEDVKNIKDTLKKYPTKFDKITKNLILHFSEQNEGLEKRIDELKDKLELNVDKKETNISNEKSEKLKEKIDLLFEKEKEKDDKLHVLTEKSKNFQLKFDGVSKIMKVNENNLLLLNEKKKKLKDKLDSLTHKSEVNKKEINLLVKKNETMAETNKKEFDLLNMKNERLQEKIDVLIQSLTANDSDNLESEKAKSGMEEKMNKSDEYKIVDERSSLEKTLIPTQEKAKRKRYKKVHQLVSSYESLCCVGELQKTSSTVLLCNSDNRDLVLMNAAKSSDENSNYLNSIQSSDNSITSNDLTTDRSNKQRDQSMTSNDSTNQGDQSGVSHQKNSGVQSDVDFRIMEQLQVENLNKTNLEYDVIMNNIASDDEESFSGDNTDSEDDNIMYNDDEFVKISIRDFKQYMKELDKTEKGRAIKKLKNNVSIINRQLSNFGAEAKKTQMKNAEKDSQLEDLIALLNKKLDSFENNFKNEEVKSYKKQEGELKAEKNSAPQNDKQASGILEDVNRRLVDLERNSKPVTDMKLTAIFDMSERIKELENLTCSLLQKEKYQKVTNSFTSSKRKQQTPFSDVDEGVCSLSETDEKSRSNEQLNKFDKVDYSETQTVVQPTSIAEENSSKLDSSSVDIHQKVSNIEKRIEQLNEVRLSAIHVHVENRISEVKSQFSPLLKQVKFCGDIDSLGKKTLDEINSMKKNMAKNVNLVNESYECILNQIEKYKTDEKDSCTELTKSVSALEEKVELINDGLDKCMKDVEGTKTRDELKKCFDLFDDMELKYQDLMNTNSLNDHYKRIQELETEYQDLMNTNSVHDHNERIQELELKYQDLTNTNSLHDHNERIQELEIRVGSAEELIKIINTKNSGYSFNQILPSTQTFKSSSEENKKSILDLRKSLTELENRLLFVFNSKIQKVEQSTMKINKEEKEIKSYENLQEKISSIEADLRNLKEFDKKSFDDIEKKLADINSDITKTSVSNDGNSKNSTTNANKKINCLESQMQSSKDLYKNLNNTVNDVKKRLSTVEGKLSEYKALNNTLQEHEECLKDLVEGIESAEKQILHLEAKVGGLTKVSSEEKSSGNKPQNGDKLPLKCQRLNNLENEKVKMKAELAELQVSLNKMEIALLLNDEKLKNDLDSLKITLHDQNKMKLELDGLKKTLQDQNKMTSELDGLKKTLYEQDKMRTELDDLKKTMHGQEEMRTELDDLKKTLHDQNDVKLYLNCLKKFTQDQKIIRSELDEIKKSLQSQKKMRSELDKLNRTKNDSTEMRSELNELKKSLHDHKKMRSELDKLNKTRNDSTEMRSELNELKMLLQDHKKMRSELDKLNISNNEFYQTRLEFDALRISYQDSYRRTSEFTDSVKKELKNFSKVKTINDNYLGNRLTALENSVKITKDESQIIELTKTVEKLSNSLKGLWNAAVVTVKDENKGKDLEVVDVKKQHREDFDFNMDSFEAYCKDYIMNTFDDLEVKFTMFKDFIKDENSDVVKAISKNSKEIDRILKSMKDYDKDQKKMNNTLSSLKDNNESDLNHTNKNEETIETKFQFDNELEKRIQDMEEGIACLENFLSITNMRVQRLRRNFGENESDSESDDEISVNENRVSLAKNTTRENTSFASYDKSGDSFSILTQEEIKDDDMNEDRAAAVTESENKLGLTEMVEKSMHLLFDIPNNNESSRSKNIDFKEPIGPTSIVDKELENAEIVLILQEMISAVVTKDIEHEKTKKDFEKVDNSKEISSTESKCVKKNIFTEMTLTESSCNEQALQVVSSEDQIVIECLIELTKNVESSLKEKADRLLDEETSKLHEEVGFTSTTEEEEAPISHNDSKETDPQNESWILLPDEKPEEKGLVQNNVA